MGKYNFNKSKTSIETLSETISNSKTFDATVEFMTHQAGNLEISFDRILTSLEHDEVSGYVNDHIQSQTYSENQGRYLIETFESSGKISKREYYLEKSGDAYLTLIKDISFIYKKKKLIKYIEKLYDSLGNSWSTKTYSVYSDPSTGKTMLEWEV